MASNVTPLSAHERRRRRADGVLQELQPGWLPHDDVNWQQKKSAQTRISILEAAIKCLAVLGYASTTTQGVAKEAGISRGAMLHHYSTKQELVEQVIEYTFYKRMQKNIDAFSKLTDAERISEMQGVEVLWESYYSLEFQAYIELAMAARTDESLRRVFETKEKVFDRINRESIAQMFPEWQEKLKEVVVANNLLTSTLLGLHIYNYISPDDDRTRLVRKVISRVLVSMREGEIDPFSL